MDRSRIILLILAVTLAAANLIIWKQVAERVWPLPSFEINRVEPVRATGWPSAPVWI